jgi:hypothetical protein
VFNRQAWHICSIDKVLPVKLRVRPETPINSDIFFQRTRSNTTITTAEITNVRGMNGRVCALVFLGLDVQTLGVPPWGNMPQGSVTAACSCQDMVLNKEGTLTASIRVERGCRVYRGAIGYPKTECTNVELIITRHGAHTATINKPDSAIDISPCTACEEQNSPCHILKMHPMR